MKTKNKIFLIVGIFLLIILSGVIIFRNITFKNDYVMVNMTTGSMEIKIPKHSFDLRISDNNISIKNIRSNRVIKKELKEILNSYKKITCNGKNYYYSEKYNYTITDYGINNHFILNTIYMKYNKYNYCDYLKLQEYTEKLDGYAKMHTFGTKAEDNKKISVMLIINGFNEKISFNASLTIQTKNEVLEKSEGTFTIEDNNFIYTRTNIIEKSNNIIIPEVSTFTIIENGILKLNENYLSNYENEIILK